MSEQKNVHSHATTLNIIVGITTVSIISFIIWMLTRCTTCH